MLQFNVNSTELAQFTPLVDIVLLQTSAGELECMRPGVHAVEILSLEDTTYMCRTISV